MKNEVKLLPCPFCKEELEVVGKDHYLAHKTNGCILQPLCFESDDNEAIKAWNTRVPMERIVDDLEEAMERQWGYYNNAKSTGNIRQMDYSDGCAEGLTTAIKIVKLEGGFEE